MDGWIPGYQVHHLQLVAPDHREQLFHPNVEPAGALNTVSGCQSGRGCMINIRYTCVLLGLVPALSDGPLCDGRSRPGRSRIGRQENTIKGRASCVFASSYSLATSYFLSQLHCKGLEQRPQFTERGY